MTDTSYSEVKRHRDRAERHPLGVKAEPGVICLQTEDPQHGGQVSSL